MCSGTGVVCRPPDLYRQEPRRGRGPHRCRREEDLEDARHELDALVKRLRPALPPGPSGVQPSVGADSRHSNHVVGRANAIAPPVSVRYEADGLVWAGFILGPAYERPPGLVHGGISALILDQLVNVAASAGMGPGMTGTLTIRFLHGTPLRPHRVEAKSEWADGTKTVAHGRILTRPDDTSDRIVCVEAEGIVVLPRWARHG